MSERIVPLETPADVRQGVLLCSARATVRWLVTGGPDQLGRWLIECVETNTPARYQRLRRTGRQLVAYGWRRFEGGGP